MRLLIIEDDAIIARILRREAVRRGHVTNSAATVAQALECIRVLPGEPHDAIISDLSLPDGSGLDVARAFPELADCFVFFTGEPADSPLREQATMISLVFTKGVHEVTELFDEVEARSK